MNMVFHRQQAVSCLLLIFTIVVYMLTPCKDTAFAQESKSSGYRSQVEAFATVDKDEATIGDKIRLTVCVRYKEGITVQFPEFNQQLGVFSIKEAGGIEVPEREGNGYFTIKRNYIVRSYEIGSTTVPSFTIKYHGNQGNGAIATNEISVTIKGVIGEGEAADDIKDILPPVDVPVKYKRLIQWAVAGLAIMFLTGIVFGLIHKFRKRPKVSVPVVRRLPHEVAYELLADLLREDLISEGLVKEYYYRITDILRHYIEDRFGLLAPERTTEEFLAEMVHTNKLEDRHKLLIQEFLEHCDMVKYAKYGPSGIEVQETYDIAKRLIDETRERLEEKQTVAG